MSKHEPGYYWFLHDDSSGELTIIKVKIRAIVARFPAVVPLLTRETKIAFAIKADISDVNATYHDAITEALVTYFEGAGIAGPRRQFKEAMIQAFGDAFDAAWVEAGAELPVDDDALDWLEERLNQETGYIDQLFQEAKELRKDKEFDFFAWISSKADNYTSTLMSIHNQAKLLADDRQLLTWHYRDTDHCDTCAKLNGQRHRASWYISRDYIPGKNGAAMTCGGYRCQCFLTDKDGKEVTI